MSKQIALFSRAQSADAAADATCEQEGNVGAEAAAGKALLSVAKAVLRRFAQSIDTCYLDGMKFSLADPGDGYTIHSYSSSELVVGELRFSSSIILLPDRIISDWQTSAAEQLQNSDFEALLELKTDLVLLGTGVQQLFPSPSKYSCLTNAGIGLEIMTTPAACRTYNILVSEGRRVAAALIL